MKADYCKVMKKTIADLLEAPWRMTKAASYLQKFIDNSLPLTQGYHPRFVHPKGPYSDIDRPDMVHMPVQGIYDNFTNGKPQPLQVTNKPAPLPKTHPKAPQPKKRKLKPPYFFLSFKKKGASILGYPRSQLRKRGRPKKEEADAPNAKRQKNDEGGDEGAEEGAEDDAACADEADE